MSSLLGIVEISKNKQAKNIFHLKIKMNQVSDIALLYWQLLHQVSHNAFLHPFIY